MHVDFKREPQQNERKQKTCFFLKFLTDAAILSPSEKEKYQSPAVRFSLQIAKRAVSMFEGFK